MNLPSISSLGVFSSAWSVDWIIIVAVATVIAFDAIRSGGTRAASLALSLPATVVMLGALSHAAFVDGLTAQFSTPLLQALLFLVIFIPIYIFTYRIIGSWGMSGGAPIEALLTGLATTAIMLVVWLSIPALDAVWHFGPQVQYVFSEPYRFWWLIASYGALSFARS